MVYCKKIIHYVNTLVTSMLLTTPLKGGDSSNMLPNLCLVTLVTLLVTCQFGHENKTLLNVGNMGLVT